MGVWDWLRSRIMAFFKISYVPIALYHARLPESPKKEKNGKSILEKTFELRMEILSSSIPKNEPNRTQYLSYVGVIKTADVAILNCLPKNETYFEILEKRLESLFISYYEHKLSNDEYLDNVEECLAEYSKWLFESSKQDSFMTFTN